VLIWGAKVLVLDQEELESGIECEHRHSFKKTIDCYYLSANNERMNKMKDAVATVVKRWKPYMFRRKTGDCNQGCEGKEVMTVVSRANN
jgi:hypothetical protein